MKVSRLLFSAAAVACLALPQTAGAATLGVAADTWVREDSSGSNRNGDAFMNARTDEDGTTNDLVFLRFDTSSLTGAAGSALNLTWYRSDGSTGKTLSLWGINDGSADDVAWDEAAITYDTAPAMAPDGMDVMTEVGLAHTDDDIHDLKSASLTLLVADQAYGPQVEGDLYSFSSAALDTFLNADTNGIVTFLITRNTNTSSNQARFTAKEATAFNSGASVPQGGAGAYLSGVTTGVPEPGSIALIGLAAAALVVRRRR
ncbi:MAG: PEP-CTERM sorting domain-containing protein [Planctomycetales bacterium]|nr:PEP-CTERM sorting domain-containing protein [Planctomycetales bacterium]